mgnify:CR=1 FL=1
MTEHYIDEIEKELVDYIWSLWKTYKKNQD